MSRPDAARPADAPVFVFAALGDRTRLSLLGRLSDGESRSIATLSADTRLTRQAVTKHLKVLQAAGLVGRVRVGRESRYSYRPGPLAEARSCLDQVAARWDEALSRLRALVEARE